MNVPLVSVALLRLPAELLLDEDELPPFFFAAAAAAAAAAASLRDCSAIWSLTVSISLVMRSYSAFCSFWYACRLFCSAFCCSSLDYSSSALYFRFS